MDLSLNKVNRDCVYSFNKQLHNQLTDSCQSGLLFHHFYALPKHIDPSLNDKELLTLLDEDTLFSYGLVHFYGGRKPWTAMHDHTLSFSAHVAEARKLWLAKHQALSSLIDAKHSYPLTPLGIERYTTARVLYDYVSRLKVITKKLIHDDMLTHIWYL